MQLVKKLILISILILLTIFSYRLLKARFEPRAPVVAPQLASKADATKHKVEAKKKLDLNDWKLLLVNWEHPVDLEYMKNLKLQSIRETDRMQYMVDERIHQELKQMLDDAKAKGIDLIVCSAFRTLEDQTELFEAQVKRRTEAGMNLAAAQEDAANWVARPGTSEHHTGLAVDIVVSYYQNLNDGFAETKAFDWLNSNCQKYGFILRYPKNKKDVTKVNYEPWHYRYVGSELAQEIENLGLCFEEYLEEHS